MIGAEVKEVRTEFREMVKRDCLIENIKSWADVGLVEIIKYLTLIVEFKNLRYRV